MTPAEKFAMCMAEAGWPVQDLTPDGPGFSFVVPHGTNENPDFWVSVYKAQALIGDPVTCCRSCYVAIKMADPWAYGHDISCEHVEVTA